MIDTIIRDGRTDEAAQKAGRFADEVIPFAERTRKGDVVVDQDEYIRRAAALDGMTKPRPAFDKETRWQPGMPPATMMARPQPFV